MIMKKLFNIKMSNNITEIMTCQQRWYGKTEKSAREKVDGIMKKKNKVPHDRYKGLTEEKRQVEFTAPLMKN